MCACAAGIRVQAPASKQLIPAQLPARGAFPSQPLEKALHAVDQDTFKGWKVVLKTTGKQLGTVRDVVVDDAGVKCAIVTQAVKLPKQGFCGTAKYHLPLHPEVVMSASQASKTLLVRPPKGSHM